eukprot:608087-Rhodomonas_salina.1
MVPTDTCCPIGVTCSMCYTVPTDTACCLALPGECGRHCGAHPGMPRFPDAVLLFMEALLLFMAGILAIYGGIAVYGGSVAVFVDSTAMYGGIADFSGLCAQYILSHYTQPSAELLAGLVSSAIRLRTCYAMSGTHLAYGATRRRPCVQTLLRTSPR